MQRRSGCPALLQPLLHAPVDPPAVRGARPYPLLRPRHQGAARPRHALCPAPGHLLQERLLDGPGDGVHRLVPVDCAAVGVEVSGLDNHCYLAGDTASSVRAWSCRA